MPLGEGLSITSPSSVTSTAPSPCHGDEHVTRTLLLQLFGIGHHVFARGKHDIEDLTQLMVVWLDEERMVRQNIHEQVARGVDNDAHAATVQARQDALVDVTGIVAGTLPDTMRMSSAVSWSILA